jgi:thioredoxin reductase (NADPH)
VLFAIGRSACTKGINLEKVNIKPESNGKLKVNDEEQTSVSNIYALGDVIFGKMELTPVAIKAGKLLAYRLFGG